MMRRWLLLVCLVVTGCGAASPTSLPTAPVANTGATSVIIGRGDDLWRLDLPAQQWTQLTAIAPNEVASYPTVSPDGKQIAFMYRAPVPTPSAAQPYVIPTTSIHLMPITGGSHSILFAPQNGTTSNEKMFDTVETPAWSADGKTIYATYRTMRFDLNDVFLRNGQDIVAINVADGSIQPLVTNGTFAAPAPDSNRIAFIRTLNDVEPHLMLFDRAANAERELFFSPSYSAMESPVWSADGKTIYLAASPNPTSGSAPWFDFLLADAAHAHGLGWRILAVDVASGKAHEINQQLFEDPRIVVRGSQLLVWTLTGLWQLDATNTATPPTRIIEQGDIGGIAPVP